MHQGDTACGHTQRNQYHQLGLRIVFIQSDLAEVEEVRNANNNPEEGKNPHRPVAQEMRLGHFMTSHSLTARPGQRTSQFSFSGQGRRASLGGR